MCCSCSYDRDKDRGIFVGETKTFNEVTLTFDSFCTTPIDDKEFWLGYTMRIKMVESLPVKDLGGPSITGIWALWELDADGNVLEESSGENYATDTDKNIEENGYDIFDMDIWDGYYVYTFFVRLPKTIWREQGRPESWEEYNVISGVFLEFDFYTCTQEEYDEMTSKNQKAE